MASGSDFDHFVVAAGEMEEDGLPIEAVAAPAEAGEDFANRKFGVAGVGREHLEGAVHGMAAGPETVLALEAAGEPFAEGGGSNGQAVAQWAVRNDGPGVAEGGGKGGCGLESVVEDFFGSGFAHRVVLDLSVWGGGWGSRESDLYVVEGVGNFVGRKVVMGFRAMRRCNRATARSDLSNFPDRHFGPVSGHFPRSWSFVHNELHPPELATSQQRRLLVQVAPPDTGSVEGIAGETGGQTDNGEEKPRAET